MLHFQAGIPNTRDMGERELLGPVKSLLGYQKGTCHGWFSWELQRQKRDLEGFRTPNPIKCYKRSPGEAPVTGVVRGQRKIWVPRNASWSLGQGPVGTGSRAESRVEGALFSTVSK